MFCLNINRGGSAVDFYALLYFHKMFPFFEGEKRHIMVWVSSLEQQDPHLLNKGINFRYNDLSGWILIQRLHLLVHVSDGYVYFNNIIFK